MIKLNKNKSHIPAFIALLVSISAIVVTAAGCENEITEPPATPASSAISETLVPDIELDMYVYVSQDEPTIVPGHLIGSSGAVDVESLALWGIPTEDTIIWGGGLTFVKTSDASRLFSQVSSHVEIWTKLSEHTIYFVQGVGDVAEKMKNAISNNHFKRYDNQVALTEVALLPDGGTTKLAAIGITIPGKTLTGLIAKKIMPEYSNMVNTLLTQAQLQVVSAGLYSPGQIDIASMIEDIEDGDIWDSELGLLALIKSGLPGVVVSPIIKGILDNAGYTETNTGEVTLYKGTLNFDNGQNIPIFIRVEGNRIYAVVSGQESYARTIITNIGP